MAKGVPASMMSHWRLDNEKRRLDLQENSKRYRERRNQRREDTKSVTEKFMAQLANERYHSFTTHMANATQVELPRRKVPEG